MDVKTFYTRYFKPGNVSTDSRLISRGDIFIALRGEKFNGNTYAKSAIEKGAAIAVIDDPEFKSITNTLLVEDSFIFLQDLARIHRKNCNCHFIGITGTNGKTTTKELIFTVLSEKYRCQATRGNLNNHIGVPLSILAIAPETEVAIIEMGANHIGEIAILCEISQPDSGLITNIGKAHLEGFGSIEGVKKAKSELYHYLTKKVKKIYLNGSDDTLLSLVGNYDNVVRYNNSDGYCDAEILKAENTLTLRMLLQNESIPVHTLLHGEYNLNNILAAACIGLKFNLKPIQIKSGLEKYKPENQRSQVISRGSTTLLLDCYNANPTSMKEAISSFLKVPSGKKIIVLGAMKELGTYSAKEHKRIGELLNNSGIDEIFLVGKEFEEVRLKNSINISDVLEIQDHIAVIDLKNTAILVKGSRANKLERIQEILFPD